MFTIAHGVEKVEDSATEQTESCWTQEENNGPSGNVMRIGKVFVQVQNLEVFRVNFFLEPINILFELIEPSTVQFFIDLLEKKRS